MRPLDLHTGPRDAAARRDALPSERVPRLSFVGWILALLLALGALGVVLAGIRSPLFDLDRYQVPKELVLHATALLLLLFLLPSWRRVQLGIVDVLLAAALAWAALSALLANNHWLALRGFGLSFSAFVVYLAARRLARGGRGMLVVAILATAATAGGLLGVAQAYGLDLPVFARSRPPGGTFGNRNFLAHLTAIAVPLLLLVRIRARGVAAGRWTLFALFVMTAAVVLTRSRAAWLALIVGLGAMAFMGVVGWRAWREAHALRRLRATVLVMGVAAIAAILVPNTLEWRSSTPYAETLNRLTDYQGGSGRGRLIQWGNSLKIVAHHPVLGVGPGNWFVYYPTVTTPGDPAFDADDPIPTNPWPSSDWVAFLVDRGPIGVLLLLFAGAAAVLVALRRTRGSDPGTALACAALVGTLCAALVAGMFDAVLLLAAPAFFVAAATGALLPASPPVVDRRLSTGDRVAAVLGGIVVAAVVAAASAGQLAGILMTRDSQSRAAVEKALRYDPGDYRLELLLSRRGSCRSRIPHARAAHALMPYHAAPRHELAACGVRVERH